MIQAWNDLPVGTIQQVFERIPIVHQLIVEVSGDNINVDDRRGHCGEAIVAAPLPVG